MVIVKKNRGELKKTQARRMASSPASLQRDATSEAEKTTTTLPISFHINALRGP